MLVPGNEEVVDGSDDTSLDSNGNDSGDSTTPSTVDEPRGGKRRMQFELPPEYDPNLDPRVRADKDKLLSRISVYERQVAEGEELKSKFEDTQKRLQALEREKMTEEEKARAEQRDLADRLAKLEGESESLRKENIRFRTAADLGMDAELVPFVTGNTVEEIQSSAERLTGVIAARTKEAVDSAVVKAKAAALEEASRTAESSITKPRDVGTVPSTTPPASGGGGSAEHIFTAAEIRGLSLDEYNANREVIRKQQNQGLIK